MSQWHDDKNTRKFLFHTFNQTSIDAFSNMLINDKCIVLTVYMHSFPPHPHLPD